MHKAVILINELVENATPDELDVLDQACAVEEALAELEYESSRIFMNLDLKSCAEAIKTAEPDVVINLVENAGRRADLIHLAPALLKSLDIPFTGCGPVSIFLTSNKLLTKRMLKAGGLPTPAWYESHEFLKPGDKTKLIVKPLWEDASVGITDKNVFSGQHEDLIADFRKKFGPDFFIEDYIPGREFNISILSSEDGPEILAPAEMKFTGFPNDKPQILGYAAKWDEGSFEFKHTTRSFEFSSTDNTLLDEIRHISLDCWNLFYLSGYARVDFRVDQNNHPYVLEINANPCISPDSGFFAACVQSGLSFTEAIHRLINQALKLHHEYHLS